jgi:hypothetical protein
MWELTASALAEATGMDITSIGDGDRAVLRLRLARVADPEGQEMLRSCAEALAVLMDVIRNGWDQESAAVQAALKISIAVIAVTEDTSLIERAIEQGGRHLRQDALRRLRDYTRENNNCEPVIALLRTHASRLNHEDFHEYCMPALRECRIHAIPAFKQILSEVQADTMKTRSVIYHLGCMGLPEALPLVAPFAQSTDADLTRTVENALNRLTGVK